MIPSHLIPTLSTAANSVIDQALKVGAPGQATPTGEVGFVAAAVIRGVPNLAAAWRPILRPAGYSLKVSGVFCHQTPQASFTDMHGAYVSCELADLLVAVDDLSTGRRWATLIQAKMAASGGGQTLSSAGDLRQLDLMTNWPVFTLPAGYSATPRDFSKCGYSGTTTDCGRYGLIAPQPNPTWHQQAPAVSMPAGGDQLGTFIAKMVETGQTGYGREATGVGDDWSLTVDELMTKTYGMLFTYMTGFSKPQHRGHSGFAFFTSDMPYFGDVFYSDAPPPSGDRPDDPRREDPGGAISVLRIGIDRVGDEGSAGR